MQKSEGFFRMVDLVPRFSGNLNLEVLSLLSLLWLFDAELHC